MIEFNNKEHGKLIAARIPRSINLEESPIISRTRDGRLLGGVYFDGYTGSCIFIHQASFDKHWLSKDFLWVVFDYAFNQLKVKKLCGTIPSSNPKLLELNTKFGFKVEAVLKDGYPDGDMLVLSMTRDECKWLSIKPMTLRPGP